MRIIEYSPGADLIPYDLFELMSGQLPNPCLDHPIQLK